MANSKLFTIRSGSETYYVAARLRTPLEAFDVFCEKYEHTYEIIDTDNWDSRVDYRVLLNGEIVHVSVELVEVIR